jgi:hypothetical protein
MTLLAHEQTPPIKFIRVDVKGAVGQIFNGAFDVSSCPRLVCLVLTSSMLTVGEEDIFSKSHVLRLTTTAHLACTRTQAYCRHFSQRFLAVDRRPRVLNVFVCRFRSRLHCAGYQRRKSARRLSHLSRATRGNASHRPRSCRAYVMPSIFGLPRISGQPSGEHRIYFRASKILSSMLGPMCETHRSYPAWSIPVLCRSCCSHHQLKSGHCHHPER